MSKAASSETPFGRAVDICGGQAKLARQLTEISGVEISQQRIWNVLNRGQKVPAELVLPIERATDGRITRHELRPDLYPSDEASPSPGAAA